MPMRFLAPWSGERFFSRNFATQFEEFINEFDRQLSPGALTESETDFTPSIDFEELEKSFLVTVDLPGMKKQDINVELHGDMVTISGERLREAKGESKYSERYYGKFSRSFALPSQVVADKIHAHFEDGVLQITIPKAEETASHSIKIS
ncbi:Hsp20/alpha crystallin family protein [Bdellovibrio sp. BCCA]|uniref:Hsp20/alpha crystallin family protein n=1 Tax=Bdellovibrio sp. BCCA TaxID=3136281 RepID=UPI0030F1ABBA